MSEDIVIKNLRKSKLFIGTANILTGICFLVVYSLTQEYLYMIVSSVLFLSSVAIVIIFSRIESKYKLKLIKLEQEKKLEQENIMEQVKNNDQTGEEK